MNQPSFKVKKNLYDKWKSLRSNFNSHDWTSKGMEYECSNCGIINQSGVFREGYDSDFTERCPNQKREHVLWWDSLTNHVKDLVLKIG